MALRLTADFPSFPSLSAAAAAMADFDGGDEEAVDRVRARDLTLTKPAGSLGRLEEGVAWLARWRRRKGAANEGPPRLDRIQHLLFAGNHGVASRGVSAYPQAVTAQMAANFARGGAAINQLCRLHDIDLKVHVFDLERPTADLASQAAMSESACLEAFLIGARMTPPDADLLTLGEMGIGNTTSAAAIYAYLFGGDVGLWCGAGTGLDEAGMVRKRAVVAAAVQRCRLEIGDLEDPVCGADTHRRGQEDPAPRGLLCLAQLGGYETAAMAGAIVAARLHGVPVMLDGYASTAAAAALAATDDRALEHCMAGHCSAERGHRAALERLRLSPLLDLGMRLGEGVGAALAAGLMRAALGLHCDMATFAEAGVDEKLQR